MPHLLDLQVAVTDACRNFDSDSEEYDKHNAGDDPAEIYQIRRISSGRQNVKSSLEDDSPP